VWVSEFSRCENALLSGGPGEALRMAIIDEPTNGDGERVTPDFAEVVLVARGIATAVAPEGGPTDVQAALLSAIANALTGFDVDYHDLEPLGCDDLAGVLDRRPLWYRQRIVHHMVLGELVLRPLPVDVAARVASYANALGVDDKFVRVARRFAQGATGLAWMDLRRSGFTEHLQQTDLANVHSQIGEFDPFVAPPPDPELEELWAAFRELAPGTLGRGVIEMYDGRGFELPGSEKGPSPYLCQHDFVHVLADYGTNLKGELEVFAFIGRADPDPKGFAWLATLVGLFETGYIADTGFFKRDVREHNIQAGGMQHRIADAIRRGKVVCEAYDTDLFEIDFHALAPRTVDEVRDMLSVPGKSAAAVDAGSPGLFDRDGMSEIQQRYADEHRRGGAQT
jgi:hypothetical protein